MSEAFRQPDRTGTAAGVPYIAFAPREPAKDTPLVVILHLMDPPRSERAMAAALPLEGIDAWKAYLGLPMMGERAPAGGFEEIQRLAFEDGLQKLLAPVVEQAAAELPAAVTDLRQQLSADGPLALVGGSAGGAAVLLALMQGVIEVSAAAVVNPATSARAVVEASEKLFGFTYIWTDAGNAKADELELPMRAHELARWQIPLRLVVGEDDDLKGLPIASRALTDKLAEGYDEAGKVSFVAIAGLGHALANEPGIDPEPRNGGARRVDESITEWLMQWLPT